MSLQLCALACIMSFSPSFAAPFGNGVCLQPSYYNGGNVNFGWDFMKGFESIKTVRIEIEPDHAAQAKGWIQQALSNGYHVVATYHKVAALGSNDPNELLAAGNWWASNYESLSTFGSFTVNLMNEWGDHTISASEYASAVSAAMALVRRAYSGPVILDAPGWGQESKTLADAVQSMSDKNVILSMHVYPGAWNQGRGHAVQSSDIDDIVGVGVPCVLGEFGGTDTGPVNVPEVVRYAKGKGCAVIGWAWNGDGGDMNMLSPSWATNPGAQSWSKSGYFDTIYNLLATSSELQLV